MPIGKTRGESRTIAFMEKRAHILVVDDEQAITDLVVNLLAAEGMDALACYSGQAALDMLARTPFDLAIVDIMMPGIDGFELCVRMRQMRDIPVIFLSAKDEEADQVVGFTLGAEDYVTKPFRPRELVARVKARLRRRQAAPQASSTLLSAGAIEVDLRTHLATLHGEPLHLTPKEFAILAILAQSVGSPVSAADLFEGAWHERFDDAAANTVMVHIRRLRKKLADIDASTTFIETAWGVGYKLRGAPGDTGHGRLKANRPASCAGACSAASFATCCCSAGPSLWPAWRSRPSWYLRSRTGWPTRPRLGAP